MSVGLLLDEEATHSNMDLQQPDLDSQRIPLPVICTVLLLYREKLYGIWPLLNAENLIRKLEGDRSDPKIYALATALCGATLSNLNQNIMHESIPMPLTATEFIEDSRRVRSTFDYMEPVTLDTILTSYFLHIFYGRQPSRTQMATFYIREAITFTHLFGMHVEETYSQHSVKDQQVMRKLYFLLFMTERYLCIQQGLPTVLQSIPLPETEDEDFPGVVTGFLNLVTLFSTPGSDFFGKWTSHGSNVSISREQLLLIQHALQRRLEISNYYNDIQMVDIVVSQHWMRSLAWKLSILLGYIMPNGKREMNVVYPSNIVQDTLSGISRFPRDAFEVHGPGMEVKLYEIATALADSILCKPEDQSCLLVGRKDTLKSLAGLLSSLNVMNPDLRHTLSQKIEVILESSSIPSALEMTEESNYLTFEDDFSEDFSIEDSLLCDDLPSFIGADLEQ